MSNLTAPTYSTAPSDKAVAPAQRVSRQLMTEIAESLRANPDTWGMILETSDLAEARKRSRLILTSKASAFQGLNLQTCIDHGTAGRYLLYARHTTQPNSKG
jgi:hypothetical protein